MPYPETPEDRESPMVDEDHGDAVEPAMTGIAKAAVLGLDRSEIDERIARVAAHPENLGESDRVDRFARAAWSGISEPGDRIAGTLVEHLGAAGALDRVLKKQAPDALLAELDACDARVTRKELVEAFARWSPRLASRQALLNLDHAARLGVRLLVPDDPEWPSGFADLGPHGPLAVWVRGRLEAVESLNRSIALVGARASTGYGEHVAMESAAGLVDRGYTIVSGAAYGIDGMAHRAALASGGTTVAILAGGVDRFYPSGHEALLTRIVDEGAVLSELPCGSAPTKWRFLQRNRLIAAASAATIVLEAGWRSGSLNTAGHAATLGRPLGAVPGPVTSAASAGCHRLIRTLDASCVTSAAEMAELVAYDSTEEPFDPRPRATEEQVRVLDALGVRAGRSVEDIAARSGLSVDTARATLGILELDGAVVRRESGWVKPRP